MRLLTAEQFDALIDGAELLRADNYGPKVYETRDSRIVKLFRVKRWWSSSMLYPYTLRFRRNSRRLQRRGYPCVAVDEIFYCHAVRRHGLVYRKLPGQPLDGLLVSDGSEAARVYVDYAAFIARLHADRIYFRSLHPGNVLLMADGRYGLIDVGDMRFPLLPISDGERRRNFRHLLRSEEFREALQHHRGEDFIEAYLAASGLSGEKTERLRKTLRRDFGRVEAGLV
jgi:hypothetical protein